MKEMIGPLDHSHLAKKIFRLNDLISLKKSLLTVKKICSSHKNVKINNMMNFFFAKYFFKIT